MKERHFVFGLEYEIYAFTTLFHKQPPLTFINLHQPDYNSRSRTLTELIDFVR